MLWQCKKFPGEWDLLSAIRDVGLTSFFAEKLDPMRSVVCSAPAPENLAAYPLSSACLPYLLPIRLLVQWPDVPKKPNPTLSMHLRCFKAF